MTSYEYWDVEVTAGVVRTMTLDELDAAYQSGLVHEHTRVKENGSFAWSTLAIVAGIEEASTPTPTGPHSLAPQVLAAEPTTDPTFLSYSRPEPDVVAPRSLRSTTRPVAFVVAAAALVAACVGIGASRMSASAPPPPAAAAAPPAVTPLPAPVETVTLTATPTPTDKRTLSDDKKRALHEADQKRVTAAEKKRAKSAPARKGAPRTKHDGFLKSGNKFDPLNGAL